MYVSPNQLGAQVTGSEQGAGVLLRNEYGCHVFCHFLCLVLFGVEGDAWFLWVV